MRLPRTAHTDLPWRIHGIASDFRVEDVWALPTPGGSDDFDRLVRRFAEGMTDGMLGDSAASRVLFAVRRRLGALFGWDEPRAGTRPPSLLDRLPADLRDGPRGPDLGPSGFASLYRLDDEWAAELANRTVHAVLHLGWVPDGRGGYRGRMAVLVKPNGTLGTLYMAAIKPFRHLLVYPALLRSVGRAWQSDAPDGKAG